MSDVRLSAHLRLSEVERSSIAQAHGIDNRVPMSDLAIRRLYLMALRFEAIRACLGGRRLVITSGYRCRKLNDLIPGAALRSRHRQLLALDVRPAMSAASALKKVRTLSFITYAYRNSPRSLHVQWADILLPR